MKYDAVIFDMDGTLLDTLADLADSVNYALRKYSMPEREFEEIRQFVGNGVRYLMRKAVSENCDSATFEEVFGEYRSYYATHCQVKTRAYGGIHELLLQLKENGIPTAIVSNKIDSAVQDLTKQYFKDMCVISVGEREGIKRKPAPDSVLEAIRVIGCKHPVYVGDSEVDVETVKNAGIDGIFVTWGFRTKDELLRAGAGVTVDTVDELYRVISGE